MAVAVRARAEEPGSAAEIVQFVSKYGATFPIFEKVDVNGANTHPLFKYLKEQKGELMGSDLKWNFGALARPLRPGAAACHAQPTP